MIEKFKLLKNKVIIFTKFKHPTIYYFLTEKIVIIYLSLIILLFILLSFYTNFQNILDNFVASFFYTIIILFLFISLIIIKSVFYKKPIGINKENIFLNINNYSYFIDLTKFSIKKITINIENLLNIKQFEDFILIKILLNYLPFDKKELFLLEAGPLDIPKLSLESFCIENETDLKMKMTSCSYFSIYYTHYFADYIFSSVSSTENLKEIKNLRNIIGKEVEKILKSSIQNFENEKSFKLIELLPNPLGITGIISIDDKFLVRKRGEKVISEINTYDWSFSGLIDINDLLHQYYLNKKEVEILDILKKEILDEIYIFNEFIKLEEIIQNVYPLGIVFNEKYLFQPELIIYLEIKDNFEFKTKFFRYLQNEKSNICLLSKNDITRKIDSIYNNKKISNNFKNLFIISFQLLENYLKKYKKV